MKSWHSLIQKIEGWRYKYQHHRFAWWGEKIIDKTLSKSSHGYHYGQSGRKKQHTKLRDFIIMLVVSIIALTSVVGYRFYNQPQLTVGKISPLTIKAPYSAQFEDTQTTLEKRQQVQTGVAPILKQDKELTQEISNKLESHLKQVDQLRKMTAPLLARNIFAFVQGLNLSWF
jgi:cyclic-di-AMP phosphodiesterase PgpH